jgi:hypothetical protein
MMEWWIILIIVGALLACLIVLAIIYATTRRNDNDNQRNGRAAAAGVGRRNFEHHRTRMRENDVDANDEMVTFDAVPHVAPQLLPLGLPAATVDTSTTIGPSGGMIRGVTDDIKHRDDSAPIATSPTSPAGVGHPTNEPIRSLANLLGQHRTAVGGKGDAKDGDDWDEPAVATAAVVTTTNTEEEKKRREHKRTHTGSGLVSGIKATQQSHVPNTATTATTAAPAGIRASLPLSSERGRLVGSGDGDGDDGEHGSRHSSDDATSSSSDKPASVMARARQSQLEHQRVAAQVAQVSNVMRNNIDSALQRGDQLNDLKEKSRELEQQSQKFEKQASHARANIFTRAWRAITGPPKSPSTTRSFADDVALAATTAVAGTGVAIGGVASSNADNKRDAHKNDEKRKPTKTSDETLAETTTVDVAEFSTNDEPNKPQPTPLPTPSDVVQGTSSPTNRVQGRKSNWDKQNIRVEATTTASGSSSTTATAGALATPFSSSTSSSESVGVSTSTTNPTTAVAAATPPYQRNELQMMDIFNTSTSSATTAASTSSTTSRPVAAMDLFGSHVPFNELKHQTVAATTSATSSSQTSTTASLWGGLPSSSSSTSSASTSSGVILSSPPAKQQLSQPHKLGSTSSSTTTTAAATSTTPSTASTTTPAGSTSPKSPRFLSTPPRVSGHPFAVPSPTAVNQEIQIPGRGELTPAERAAQVAKEETIRQQALAYEEQQRRAAEEDRYRREKVEAEVLARERERQLQQQQQQQQLQHEREQAERYATQQHQQRQEHQQQRIGDEQRAREQQERHHRQQQLHAAAAAAAAAAAVASGSPASPRAEVKRQEKLADKPSRTEDRERASGTTAASPTTKVVDDKKREEQGAESTTGSTHVRQPSSASTMTKPLFIPGDVEGASGESGGDDDDKESTMSPPPQSGGTGMLRATSSGPSTPTTTTEAASVALGGDSGSSPRRQPHDGTGHAVLAKELSITHSPSRVSDVVSPSTTVVTPSSSKGHDSSTDGKADSTMGQHDSKHALPSVTTKTPAVGQPATTTTTTSTTAIPSTNVTMNKDEDGHSDDENDATNRDHGGDDWADDDYDEEEEEPQHDVEDDDDDDDKRSAPITAATASLPKTTDKEEKEGGRRQSRAGTATAVTATLAGAHLSVASSDRSRDTKQQNKKPGTKGSSTSSTQSGSKPKATGTLPSSSSSTKTRGSGSGTIPAGNKRGSRQGRGRGTTTSSTSRLRQQQRSEDDRRRSLSPSSSSSIVPSTSAASASSTSTPTNRPHSGHSSTSTRSPTSSTRSSTSGSDRGGEVRVAPLSTTEGSEVSRRGSEKKKAETKAHVDNELLVGAATVVTPSKHSPTTVATRSSSTIDDIRKGGLLRKKSRTELAKDVEHDAPVAATTTVTPTKKDTPSSRVSSIPTTEDTRRSGDGKSGTKKPAKSPAKQQPPPQPVKKVMDIQSRGLPPPSPATTTTTATTTTPTSAKKMDPFGGLGMLHDIGGTTTSSTIAHAEAKSSTATKPATPTISTLPTSTTPITTPSATPTSSKPAPTTSTTTTKTDGSDLFALFDDEQPTISATTNTAAITSTTTTPSSSVSTAPTTSINDPFSFVPHHTSTTTATTPTPTATPITAAEPRPPRWFDEEPPLAAPSSSEGVSTSTGKRAPPARPIPASTAGTSSSFFGLAPSPAKQQPLGGSFGGFGTQNTQQYGVLPSNAFAPQYSQSQSPYLQSQHHHQQPSFAQYAQPPSHGMGGGSLPQSGSVPGGYPQQGSGHAPPPPGMPIPFGSPGYGSSPAKQQPQLNSDLLADFFGNPSSTSTSSTTSSSVDYRTFDPFALSSSTTTSSSSSLSSSSSTPPAQQVALSFGGVPVNQQPNWFQQLPQQQAITTPTSGTGAGFGFTPAAAAPSGSGQSFSSPASSQNVNTGFGSIGGAHVYPSPSHVGGSFGGFGTQNTQQYGVLPSNAFAPQYSQSQSPYLQSQHHHQQPSFAQYAQPPSHGMGGGSLPQSGSVPGGYPQQSGGHAQPPPGMPIPFGSPGYGQPATSATGAGYSRFASESFLPPSPATRQVGDGGGTGGQVVPSMAPVPPPPNGGMRPPSSAYQPFDLGAFGGAVPPPQSVPRQTPLVASSPTSSPQFDIFGNAPLSAPQQIVSNGGPAGPSSPFSNNNSNTGAVVGAATPMGSGEYARLNSDVFPPFGSPPPIPAKSPAKQSTTPATATPTSGSSAGYGRFDPHSFDPFAALVNNAAATAVTPSPTPAPTTVTGVKLSDSRPATPTTKLDEKLMTRGGLADIIPTMNADVTLPPPTTAVSTTIPNVPATITPATTTVPPPSNTITSSDGTQFLVEMDHGDFTPQPPPPSTATSMGGLGLDGTHSRHSSLIGTGDTKSSDSSDTKRTSFSGLETKTQLPTSSSSSSITTASASTKDSRSHYDRPLAGEGVINVLSSDDNKSSTYASLPASAMVDPATTTQSSVPSKVATVIAPPITPSTGPSIYGNYGSTLASPFDAMQSYGQIPGTPAITPSTSSTPPSASAINGKSDLYGNYGRTPYDRPISIDPTPSSSSTPSLSSSSSIPRRSSGNGVPSSPSGTVLTASPPPLMSSASMPNDRSIIVPPVPAPPPVPKDDVNFRYIISHIFIFS